MRACLAAAALAACLALALPAVASAKDYCVFPNVGCGGVNAANLETALDQADNDPDADRILLGAWTYVAPTTSGFDYSQSNAPVEIIGRGAGQTALTGPSGASGVLRLFGGPGSSIHDLSIRMPNNVAYGSAGLSTDGAASRLDVVEDQQPQSPLRTGVHLENGGVLEDSSVKLDGVVPQTRAVWMDSGGGTVRDSTVVAYLGVASAYGGTIERSRLLTGGVGVVGGRNVTTVRSSVIQMGGTPGVGLLANPLPGSPSTINADGITFVGPGHNSTRAAMVNTLAAPGENADISLTNSIIGASSLEVNATGAGHATIAVSYSDRDPIPNEINGTNAKISESNMSNVGNAGFADPALGDYHLLPSSPLIDAGDPSTAQGGDMDGKPLVVDGNGDGTARRDMGAFEFQTGLPEAGSPPPAGGGGAGTPVDTQAPLIGSFRAAPALFALARGATPMAARVPRGTRFRYTLSEPARITITLKRAHSRRRVGVLRRAGAKGANSIRFSGRIGKRALRPGRYRAAIVAIDAAGNRSALRTTAFRVAAS